MTNALLMFYLIGLLVHVILIAVSINLINQQKRNEKLLEEYMKALTPRKVSPFRTPRRL